MGKRQSRLAVDSIQVAALTAIEIGQPAAGPAKHIVRVDGNLEGTASSEDPASTANDVGSAGEADGAASSVSLASGTSGDELRSAGYVLGSSHNHSGGLGSEWFASCGSGEDQEERTELSAADVTSVPVNKCAGHRLDEGTDRNSKISVNAEDPQNPVAGESKDGGKVPSKYSSGSECAADKGGSLHVRNAQKAFAQNTRVQTAGSRVLVKADVHAAESISSKEAGTFRDTDSKLSVEDYSMDETDADDSRIASGKTDVSASEGKKTGDFTVFTSISRSPEEMDDNSSVEEADTFFGSVSAEEAESSNSSNYRSAENVSSASTDDSSAAKKEEEYMSLEDMAAVEDGSNTLSSGDSCGSQQDENNPSSGDATYTEGEEGFPAVDLLAEEGEGDFSLADVEDNMSSEDDSSAETEDTLATKDTDTHYKKGTNFSTENTDDIFSDSNLNVINAEDSTYSADVDLFRNEMNDIHTNKISPERANNNPSSRNLNCCANTEVKLKLVEVAENMASHHSEGRQSTQDLKGSNLSLQDPTIVQTTGGFTIDEKKAGVEKITKTTFVNERAAEKDERPESMTGIIAAEDANRTTILTDVTPTKDSLHVALTDATRKVSFAEITDKITLAEKRKTSTLENEQTVDSTNDEHRINRKEDKRKSSSSTDEFKMAPTEDTGTAILTESTCEAATNESARRSSENRDYVCKKCGNYYVLSEHLLAHELEHTPGQVYLGLRCGGCGAQFHFVKSLDNHLQRNWTTAGFRCHRCRQWFKRCEDLYRHEQWQQFRKHGPLSVLGSKGFLVRKTHKHFLTRY